MARGCPVLADWRQRLGLRLRAARQRCGLTQEQVAERVGVHVTHIAKIEGGERTPSLDALVRIAQALEVGVAEITAAIDEPPQPGLEPALGEVLAVLRRCDARRLRLLLRIAEAVAAEP